jgi:4'-phosphopantetheinyl transferase
VFPAWHRSQPPQPFEPKQIHVWAWTLESDGVDLGAHTALLDEQEFARFDRFHFDRDRARFAISHANMRRILAAYLTQPPERIRFISNRYGKPELAGERTGGIRFNLSHSQSMGMLALSPGIEVGVDVEDFRPIEPEVARSSFSAGEIAELAKLQGHAWLAGFYACWTRKEAVVKAEGLGLSLPLDAFDVSLAPGSPAEILKTLPPVVLRHRWKLHDLSPGPETPGAERAAALAAALPEASVACFRLEEKSHPSGS